MEIITRVTVVCKITLEIKYKNSLYSALDASIALKTGHEQPHDVVRASPAVCCVGKITRCEALQRCIVRGNTAAIREETGAFNSQSNVHLAFFNRPLVCVRVSVCVYVCILASVRIFQLILPSTNPNSNSVLSYLIRTNKLGVLLTALEVLFWRLTHIKSMAVQ